MERPSGSPHRRRIASPGASTARWGAAPGGRAGASPRRDRGSAPGASTDRGSADTRASNPNPRAISSAHGRFGRRAAVPRSRQTVRPGSGARPRRRARSSVAAQPLQHVGGLEDQGEHPIDHAAVEVDSIDRCHRVHCPVTFCFAEALCCLAMAQSRSSICVNRENMKIPARVSGHYHTLGRVVGDRLGRQIAEKNPASLRDR